MHKYINIGSRRFGISIDADFRTGWYVTGEETRTHHLLAVNLVRHLDGNGTALELVVGPFAVAVAIAKPVD
jgi:hypothetical protein